MLPTRPQWPILVSNTTVLLTRALGVFQGKQDEKESVELVKVAWRVAEENCKKCK